MIVLAREVFLCKCSTDVPPAPEGDGPGQDLRFASGSEEHFPLLDPVHHGDEHLRDFRARLARGERWLIGLDATRGRIATYTWLHLRPRCEYPYLPGCAFELPADHAYGYDAWTDPALRGGGLRRRAFVEELRWLRLLGRTWEASYFVAHQLEGASRSLAQAGVEIVPLWRVALGPGRRLVRERLAPCPGVTPVTPSG